MRRPQRWTAPPPWNEARSVGLDGDVQFPAHPFHVDKYEASQDIPDFPYAAYAESIGLRGIRVESPDAVEAAWDTAFASDRPVVVEAITAPDVPPMPPHISFEHASNYLRAMLKGDVDAWSTLRASFHDAVESFLPHPAGR